MRRRPAGREEEEELTNIYLSNLVKISAENLLAFAQPRVLKAEKSVTWGIGEKSLYTPFIRINSDSGLADEPWSTERNIKKRISK